MGLLLRHPLCLSRVNIWVENKTTKRKWEECARDTVPVHAILARARALSPSRVIVLACSLFFARASPLARLLALSYLLFTRTRTHTRTNTHSHTHRRMEVRFKRTRFATTLQHTILYTLQHTATHCNTLQHTAARCNTLQHTATHRRTEVKCKCTRFPSLRRLCSRCVCVAHVLQMCVLQQCVCCSSVCAAAVCVAVCVASSGCPSHSLHLYMHILKSPGMHTFTHLHIRLHTIYRFTHVCIPVVYTCIYLHICMHIPTYKHTSHHLHAHTYQHAHTYLYICKSQRSYIHIYYTFRICWYILMYTYRLARFSKSASCIYMYIYTYIHIYTYTYIYYTIYITQMKTRRTHSLTSF